MHLWHGITWLYLNGQLRKPNLNTTENVWQIKKDFRPELKNFSPNKLVTGRKDMFYLTTHSTHFYLRLYGVRHMVTKNHSDREETCCRHIGYSFQLATRVLLYASSHGLCYTSRGALAGNENWWLENNNCGNMDESGAELYKNINGQHATEHCPVYREESRTGRVLIQHTVIFIVHF